MKKKHLIILGAGKPHYGNDPSSLKKIFQNYSTLSFILELSKKLNFKTTYVSGFKSEKIKKKFPNLKVIFNNKWDKTGPVYSLNKVPLEDNEDIIIIYSDVLVRYETLKNLSETKDDFTCVIDSNYEKRYKYRNIKNLYTKEKVFFRSNKAYYFSHKDNIKKSAELIGLIKIKKNKVKFIKKILLQINNKPNNYKFCDLLKKINKKTFIKFLDIKGNWAEINEINDISKFILGTKSETLNQLKNVIKNGKILDQVKFSVADWRRAKKRTVQNIINKFKSKALIVRSSALDEDGDNISNAGKYLSVLRVKGKKNISNAVNKVIKSFGSKNYNNEIFIQPYLKNSKYVGVVTTKTKGVGSPWYVINYQKTNNTEAITKGDSNKIKTLFLRRDLKIKELKENFLKKLLDSVKELENLLMNNNLDIEFAIGKKNKIYIFQVRPLFVKPKPRKFERIILKKYKKNENKYNYYKLRSNFSDSNKIIFGVMPDWNPAEIIGFKPSNLSLSLYQKLITQNNWAKQRYQFGYKKIKSPKLIEDFCGTPYVCVNKSIESFLPNKLSNVISKKICNISLNKLIENPNKHDKIEFDIIPNCLDFDFKNWKKFYSKNGILNKELNIYMNSLKNINKGAMKTYLINSSKLDFYKNLQLPNSGNSFEKIKNLLEICTNELTLMFAHFARCGFISVIIMNSALKRKKINQKSYNNFFNSIKTISKEFQNDIKLYKNKRLTKSYIIRKYGHLRPGTYDITSPRYDEKLDLILKEPITKSISYKDCYKKSSTFSEKFLNDLKEIGLSGNKADIIDFFFGSVEKRESSKFLFTKYLSEILKLISKELKKIELSNQDISMLSINDIINYLSKKINIHELRKKMIKNRKDYNYNLLCDMPNIITSKKDFKQFELLTDEPNFVGEKTINSKILKISKFENYRSLRGKIIMIDSADPGFDWIFNCKIVGLITKFGGTNSHMAIRCAELNLSAAIGVGEKIFQNLQYSNKVYLDPKNKILKPV